MRRYLGIGFTLLLIVACTRRETPEPSAPPPEPPPPPSEAQQQQPAEPAALVGTAWVVDRIEGKGDIDNKESTLEFLEAGRAAGRAGCNRYGGPVEISGNSLRFGDLMSTKMACDPPLMEQEQQFLKALADVGEYKIEDRKLVLLDRAGKPLLRLETNRDPSS
jgi:putative lipoprotein